MLLSEEVKIGIIAGSSIGVLVVVVILIVIFWCCWRSNSKPRKFRFSRRDLSHLTRPLPIKIDNETSKPAPFYIIPACSESRPSTGGVLPKVGSSGLWFSRSSMLGPSLSATPPNTNRPLIPHTTLMKATSEPRLSGQPFSYCNIGLYNSQVLPPLYESAEQKRQNLIKDGHNLTESQLHGLQFSQQSTRPKSLGLSDPYLSEPIAVFERDAMQPTMCTNTVQSDKTRRPEKRTTPQTPRKSRNKPSHRGDIVSQRRAVSSENIHQRYDCSENFFFRAKIVPASMTATNKNDGVLAKLHKSKAPSKPPLPSSTHVYKYKDGEDQNGTRTTVTSGYDSGRSREFVQDDYNNNVREGKGSGKKVNSYNFNSESSDLEAKLVTSAAFQFLDNYIDDEDTTSIIQPSSS